MVTLLQYHERWIRFQAPVIFGFLHVWFQTSRCLFICLHDICFGSFLFCPAMVFFHGGANLIYGYFDRVHIHWSVIVIRLLNVSKSVLRWNVMEEPSRPGFTHGKDLCHPSHFDVFCIFPSFRNFSFKIDKFGFGSAFL